MTEIPTEREALLEARVKELEAAAAQRKTAGAGAGIVEQVWHYFTAFVPPWIIACGLAIILGFHAWEYFNKAQMQTAETQSQKAQAALKDANARAQADLIEVAGQATPLQTEIAKAEAEKAKQEAAQAQVEADALNAKIGDETARLATARAELAGKQAQMQKARAEADAKTTMSGLLTLSNMPSVLN
jgi:VIT1/CCC1 family predicted Fe2+/Mn2+ transporter